MKQGWEIKKLGEVCEELFAGGDVPKGNTSKFKTDDYQIPIFSNGEKNKGLYGFTNVARVLKPSITISARGTIGYSEIRNESFYPAIRLIVVIPKTNILDLFFLKYVVSGIDFKHSGSSIPQLTVPMIKGYPIPLPSLPEQQRIVAILDEVFESIAKAKANAEQNLKNAKELFESYLQNVFETKGEGWEEKNFEDCFKLKSGDGLTSKNMSENGEYPVFGGNGIAGLHNNFNLSGSNVIIGRVGALCGNVRHITENIWLTDNAFKVVGLKFDYDHSFLTYLLNYKNLRSFARQAAQPVISNSSLKNVALEFPKSLKEQQNIAQKLDVLLLETKKLEVIYQQKINDLEELKKSVLQKAFSGELKIQSYAESV